MHAVSVRDASKRYGALPALDGLNLEVRAAEFVALLGPSGCGKSTLLNVIAGLEELDAGSVHIADRDVTRLEPHRRDIAMVFQSYALYPTMTVAENLSFALRMAGTPAAQIRKRVAAVAELLRIGELLARRPAQLSGGQRQRVAIGRAIVREAGLYLFDEPLSNLDANLRAEMRQEIRRLHQRLGATMIYVTHDQVEAMSLASRIAVMRQGRIEQMDEPQAMYAQPATAFVAGFVGSPPMNLLPGTLRRTGGHVWVELPGGPMPLGSYRFSVNAPDAPDAQPVTVGIRPEDVCVRAGDDARQWNAACQCGDARAACFELPVIAREPLGATCIVWCQFGTERLAAMIDSRAAAALPSRVRLQLRADRISIFCARSATRL